MNLVDKITKLTGETYVTLHITSHHITSLLQYITLYYISYNICIHVHTTYRRLRARRALSTLWGGLSLIGISPCRARSPLYIMIPIVNYFHFLLKSHK